MCNLQRDDELCSESVVGRRDSVVTGNLPARCIAVGCLAQVICSKANLSAE